VLTDVQAGFDFGGTFYPLTGWIAYSKVPYKDDLMAGVRIYCRGKIAAQSHIFNPESRSDYPRRRRRAGQRRR